MPALGTDLEGDSGVPTLAGDLANGVSAILTIVMETLPLARCGRMTASHVGRGRAGEVVWRTLAVPGIHVQSLGRHVRNLQTQCQETCKS